MQQAEREPERNGLSGGFQVWKDRMLCLGPVKVIDETMVGPKISFRVLVYKFWNLFKFFHKGCVHIYPYHVLK